MVNLKNAIIAAEQRIRPYILETPLYYSTPLSHLTGAHVYLKCENLQNTGSFKVRGAFNKLLSLSAIEQQQGIVTASSGNHGAAVAYALSLLHLEGRLFVPENVSPTKIDNIRNYKIALEFYGTDCMHAELRALAYAKEYHQVYISPYNDWDVIAGQGTIAVELKRQLDKIDAVFVPVGGGGLIAGIAAYMKSTSPETSMIGCLPELSPVMAASIKAGRILAMDTYPTLSDATAGGIEPDAITFGLCQNSVDDYILVSESQIQAAIIKLIETHHLLIEGASGVALAAMLKHAHLFQGKNLVVVLSGANISIETLKKLLY